MAELVVVLGGIRSGKSAVAEQLVAVAPAVTYVATAAAGDAEMAERIAAHRARRPAHWRTVEELDPAAAVAAAPRDAAVLVDGLGGWLTTRMVAAGPLTEGAAAVTPLDERGVAARAALLAAADALVAAAADHPGGPVVVVAEEVGMGVVAADPSTRRWVDLAGEIVQRLAARAGRVLLVVAGRGVELPPVPAHATWTLAGSDDGDLRAHGDTMVPAGALDFAVNIHGDGPPPHLRAALGAAVRRAGRYPDATAATAAVAARHARPPAEVLPTAGAADALWLLAGAVAARSAVVVHPQFGEPEAALRAAGVPVRRVLRRPDDGWALHPDEVPADADLVIVGNPNNPTGTLDDPDRVAALCRPGRVTVVDEAFVDFVADPTASLASRRDLPGLVVVRSVTKLWGLAGIRAGYLVAPAGLIARCAARRQPWPLGVAALTALELCAGDEAYRRDVAARVAAHRGHLLAALREISGVRCYDAAANFVLCRVPDGPRVHRRLLDRGVAVRPSTFPGLDTDHLRIAVRDPDATAVLVAALSDVLTGAAV